MAPESRFVEPAISETENRFRSMAEDAPIMIWVTGENGDCTYINSRWREFTGTTLEENLGLGWTNSVHPEDRESAKDAFLQANEERTTVRAIYRLRRLDGQYRWMLDSATPRFAPDGKFLGYIGSVVDFTEEKVREEELRRSEATFFNLIQNNPFGVYLVDSDFRLRQVSLGAQKVFSHVRPLLGRDFADVLRNIWQEPFATEAINRFRHTLETGEPYVSRDTTEQRADVDSVESYDWRIERVVLPDGRFGVVCYFYDMTERHQLETELRDRARQLEAVYASSPVGLGLLDKELRYVQINKVLAGMNGKPIEAHLGKTIREVLPEAADLLESVMHEVLQGQSFINVEFPWQVPDTGETRHFLASFTPILEKSGAVKLINCVVQETTDRKRAEETLLRTEKLAAAGRLAATIAHEMNNPLESATNLIYLAAQEQVDPDTLREYLQLADQELRRASHIARQTLGFYRENVSPEVFDVQQELETLLYLFQRRFQQKNLVVETQMSPAKVLAVRNEVGQVFTNLLSNAMDASPMGGRITVRVKNTGATCSVTIADHGHGITPDHSKRLFEPFFTTKKDYGTGLGLWVSKALIERNGGRIRVRSTSKGPNRGAFFVVALPSAA